MTVQTSHILGVGFPAPDLISNKRVRGAYEALLRQHGITDEAVRRIQRSAAEREAQKADAVRRFREALDGADDVEAAFAAAEDAPAVRSSEEMQRQAEAVRQASATAEHEAMLRLVATVDANAEPWLKELLKSTQVELDRLMNVLRALQVASANVQVVLGFAEMLEARRTGSDSGALNLLRAGGVVAFLDTAEVPLREGIGRLVLRLDELKRPAVAEPPTDEPMTITVGD